VGGGLFPELEPEPEAAADAPGQRKRWSHSKLECYRNCPRAYRFRYIDRIRTERESIEGFMGARVHEALERLYQQVVMTRLPPVEEVVEHYHDRWRAEFSTNVEVIRPDRTADDYRRLGEECLRTFYRLRHPFDDGRTVGLEKTLEFTIGPGNHPMIGVIDRLVEVGPGQYEIHDYKTRQRLPDPWDLERDPQLALYQHGLVQLQPEVRSVRLVWHYLVHGRVLVSERTPERVRVAVGEAVRTIERIEADQAFEPRESPLCRWCEYRPICPVFQEPRTEAGAALVRRYGELKRRVEELRLAQAGLREEVAAYARARGLETIRGDGSSLEVERRSRWIEKAGEDGGALRARVLDRLAELGLLASSVTLDADALGAALEAGRLPPDVSDAVRPLLEKKYYPHIALHEEEARGGGPAP